MKTLLTISFALFFALCATANQENPTTNTIPVIDRLASIAWKQNLGGDDLSFVTNSLFSESDLVSQEALTALVAAAPMECLDLYAAAEKSRRPRRTTCIRVANILLEGGRKGERLLSTLRSSFIRENLPKQVGYVSGPYAGRFSPSQERHATALASRIAAIVIAKDLRAAFLIDRCRCVQALKPLGFRADQHDAYWLACLRCHKELETALRDLKRHHESWNDGLLRAFESGSFDETRWRKDRNWFAIAENGLRQPRDALALVIEDWISVSDSFRSFRGPKSRGCSWIRKFRTKTGSQSWRGSPKNQNQTKTSTANRNPPSTHNNP